MKVISDVDAKALREQVLSINNCDADIIMFLESMHYFKSRESKTPHFMLVQAYKMVEEVETYINFSISVHAEGKIIFSNGDKASGVSAGGKLWSKSSNAEMIVCKLNVNNNDYVCIFSNGIFPNECHYIFKYAQETGDFIEIERKSKEYGFVLSEFRGFNKEVLESQW